MDKTTFQGRYARANKRRVDVGIPDSGMLCKIKNLPEGDEIANEANKQSKFIRSELSKLNSIPLFENLNKSQGYSWSFLNFTSNPVTVIDRHGMRILLTSTPIQEMRHLSDREADYFRKGNCIYAIKQYALTSFQIETLFNYIVICNDEKLQNDFIESMRLSPVFKEVSEMIKTLYNMTRSVNKPTRLAERIDEAVALFLDYAEFERSLSEPWRHRDNDIIDSMLTYRRGQMCDQMYIPYFRFPLVFRIDSERISHAGDRGVYDEHSDCVFTFADFNSEVFHPYDVNINKPLTAGQLVHGGRMENLVLKHLEEHIESTGAIVDYHYVIDETKYQGDHRPKDLYISSSIQGVAKRLKPEVGNPELYSEGYGVYVTYTDYDHDTGKNVVKRKFIDINDYAMLERFGVFEGESTARAKTDKKARTEWEVANDTAHAKEIKAYIALETELKAIARENEINKAALSERELKHEQDMEKERNRHVEEMKARELAYERESQRMVEETKRKIQEYKARLKEERREHKREMEKMRNAMAMHELNMSQRDKEDERKNNTADKDSKRKMWTDTFKVICGFLAGLAGAVVPYVVNGIKFFFSSKMVVPIAAAAFI